MTCEFLFLAKNPIPVRCPIAGKYKFKQKGEMPFVSRILGGLTQSPRPNIRCMENISDFSVCDTEQREITIDQNYCLSVDHLGRPVDIYSNFHHFIRSSVRPAYYSNFYDHFFRRSRLQNEMRRLLEGEPEIVFNYLRSVGCLF